MTEDGRTPLRVLLVEDCEEDALLVLAELKRARYEVSHERVQTAADLRAALQRGVWDIVVSDATMPTFDALGTLAVVAESGIDVPVVIVSGSIDEESAVAVLRAGARDFVLKGRLARLAPAIARELRDARSRRALRRREEELHEAQKLEAVGRIAAGVAHDFNNVLAVVDVYATTLAGELRPPNPLAEDVAEIRAAVQRGTALIQQLLAFAREQPLQPRLVDLTDVVRRIERSLRDLVGARIELRVRSARGPAHVEIDPTQLERIVMNLVVNARDAMPTGGTITISIGEEEDDDGEDGPPSRAGYVRLAVTDTGTGMDRATQARIFEPFFTTKGASGTGLGLSTVFGIVKQSGGHVYVRSAPGEGATFRLYLPRTPRPVVS